MYFIPNRFKDKVAIVTGAAMGIGSGVARHLAAEGAKVVLTDWVKDAGQKMAEQIRADGGEATFIYADVADSTQIQAVIKKAVEKYEKIDVAANIAGVGGDIATMGEYPEDNWHYVTHNNIDGIFLSQKYEIQQLVKQGTGGSIVNASSIGGFVTSRCSGAYITSKHAILGITRTAAAEYGDRGIRVNSICPHVVQTPMVERGMQIAPGFKERLVASIPMRRMSNIDEVSRAILFMLSDECPFMTGASLIVDGAWSLE